MSAIDAIITPIYNGSRVDFYMIICDADLPTILNKVRGIAQVLAVGKNIWHVYPSRASQGLDKRIKNALKEAS